MNIEIELPDLGDDAGDQATVSEWRFEEGDQVIEGDDLIEVATDDETIQVPAPVSGLLIEKLVEEDDLVRVGDPLAIIETPDEEEEFALVSDDDG